MGFKEISAAVAVAQFKGRNITVQEARPAKLKGEDGKMREGFEAKEAALKEAHVVSAKLYDDGRLTITTIDGRRHEQAGVKIEAEKQ